MLNDVSTRARLERTVFPEYELFRESCEKGLSVIYPFVSSDSPDPNGWKFGRGWPPSYKAFGRMRSLLAVHDALESKPKRVLEVAAGGGGLAAALASQGSEVSVNDLRDTDLRTAINEYTTSRQITICGGNFFDLSPALTGKFDLVVACEIIEHVARPIELLKHLKGFLNPNGRVLLTTPNGSYFRNKLPTFSEIKDFDDLETQQFKPDADGHLFLLTPQELSGVAASAGLVVERLNAWGTPLLNGHVLCRIFAGRSLTWTAYQVEKLTQRLPPFGREYLCFALSAILRAAS